MKVPRRSVLVVEPERGLANRMRVIDSAIALSRDCGAKLCVIWRHNRELDCSLERLWHRPAPIDKLISIERSQSPLAKLNRVRRRILQWRSDRILTSPQIIGLNRGGNRAELLRSYLDDRRLYIRTCHRFYRSKNPYRDFRPIDSLLEIIDSYSSPGARLVGVHIRRTDNQKSIKYSPTDAFVTQMQAELQAHPETVFFLATDSAREETELRQLFPDRKIISHRKRTLRRDRAEGIEDALIDLYCLSNCDKLIGSYWSALSETAYQIRGIDHVIVRG